MMSDPALLTPRRLNWSACYNTRDLGLLPTECGGRTRWGAVVRSDFCARLDAEGWQALVAHGVRTIVDLRSPWELAREDYVVARDAAESGVVRLSLPVVIADLELVELLRDPANHTREYAILTERCAANIAAIMRAIAQAREGGVLIHCHAGKDRTGIIVALLLGLVGVSEEIIMADYVESQPALRPLWQQMLREAQDADQELDSTLAEPLAWPTVMQYLLDDLRERQGGANGYLTRIGLTDREIASLAARIIE